MQFTSYLVAPREREAKQGIAGDRHRIILQDSMGHMWFGGAPVSGLSDFDPVTETAVVYFPASNDPDGLLGDNIRDII
jgi:hypothetical protein